MARNFRLRPVSQRKRLERDRHLDTALEQVSGPRQLLAKRADRIGQPARVNPQHLTAPLHNHRGNPLVVRVVQRIGQSQHCRQRHQFSAALRRQPRKNRMVRRRQSPAVIVRHDGDTLQVLFRPSDGRRQAADLPITALAMPAAIFVATHIVHHRRRLQDSPRRF